jgi:hypothetical protein
MRLAPLSAARDPYMSDIHAYFCAAALVWERFYADKIGWAEREAQLASLRARYFAPRG